MRHSIALLLAVSGALTAVSSARAADACPNAQFRTGAGANLPECRAWEQVSPVDKNGTNVNERGPGLLTSGDRAVYVTLGSFVDANSGPALPVQSSDRSASGWSTRNVDSPIFSGPRPQSAQLVQVVTQAVSADASRAIVVSNLKLTPDAIDQGSNFFVRDVASGELRLAFSVADDGTLANKTVAVGEPQVPAFTDDMAHFAFGSDLRLTPDAAPDQNALYQVDDGVLRLASVLPNGRPAPVGGTQPPQAQRYSADGRRLTMTLRPPNTDLSSVLYQRVDAKRTVLVSRSQRRGADPETPVDTTLNRPSSDGKTVVFLSAGQPLTDASPLAQPGQSYPARIYRWRADGDRLDDLLAGVVPADVDPQVSNVDQISSDGRFVWFTSSAVLRPDATEGGQNRYVLDTTSSRLSFVATVRPTFTDVSPTSTFNRAGTRTAVDTDGGVVSFDAAAPAAGPTCVTCELSAAPTSVRFGTATGITTTLRSHTVTDDGRVFFDSPDRLLAQDVNAVSDVYEYVPGQGLKLVTSGSGAWPATLTEVGPTGDDVFFATRDALVGQDSDELVDYYDARVGGGLASQQPAPSVPACQSDGCRGPVPAGSDFVSPGAPSPASSATPSFTLRTPSASARKVAARRGRLGVPVRTSVAGRIAVRITATIKGKRKTVGSASRKVARAATTGVTVRLSAAARRKLRRSGRLRLTVSATFSAAPGRQSKRVVLERAPKPNRGGRS